MRFGSPVTATIIAAGLVLAACGGGSATEVGLDNDSVGTRVEVDGGAYTDITPRLLRSWLENKDFLFVNVHIPYEGESEPTDEFIPFDEIEGHLDSLPQRDAKVVLDCRSGSMGATAARTLVRPGYTNYGTWTAA